MATISIDPAKRLGRVKPVHGVGQPPFYGVEFSYIHYLKEAGVPYSRLHDLGFYQGGHFVDIHCVFPDFDADASDPSSYDFAFTDRLMAALVENGVEPFFRLGETIENYCAIRAYHIFPPKDYLHWAQICEGIIRHYTEGWADGFRYHIEHWEIWNEPDNGVTFPENQCWTGTKEEFYALYGVASRYLKDRFPHLKIGGYASCGFYAVTGGDGSGGNCTPRTRYFIEFFDGFLDYVRAHDCPLDFFSWHTYDANLNNVRAAAEYARRRLDEAGFSATTSSCNEWNLRHELRGTPQHAALTAAALITFQNAPVDNACFYDARYGVSSYGGLFEPVECKPYPAYYAFCAFNELYRRGEQIEAGCADDREVCAAAATDGESVAVMIVNNGEKEKPLSLSLDGIVACRLVCAGNDYGEVDLPAALPPFGILLVTAKA